MHRYWIVAAAFTGALHAQSADVKQAYTAIKNNLMKMAEKMPEENYSFKPSPDIRTFGELVAHVAESQTRSCSAIAGSMKQANAGSKTSKADLVAALKDSFAMCDGVYDALTDTNAAEKIKTPRGEMTKLGALMRNVVHDNEEYGYMAVYLRLKGIVPPSSERR